MAVVARIDENISFQPERFKPVLVAETQRLKALVVCLEAGQFIPVHAPNVDLVFVVMEGTGTVVAGDQEQVVGPGALVCVPAGEARGVKADTRLVALHVVTPPPTPEDHAQVMAGLKQGRWK